MAVLGKILVVEDDAALAETFRYHLHRAQYEVSLLLNVSDVVTSVLVTTPDLIVLDMQSDADTVELCQAVHKFLDVPLIIVSACSDELSMESGCDDYLCKPVNPRELVVRVNAVLRRTVAGEATVEPLPLYLDGESYSARWYNSRVALTLVEFQLLHLLASEPERCFRRDEIRKFIYRDGREMQNRSIDSHVKNLRRKPARLTNNDNPVRSVYGEGYMLDLNA